MDNPMFDWKAFEQTKPLRICGFLKIKGLDFLWKISS